MWRSSPRRSRRRVRPIIVFLLGVAILIFGVAYVTKSFMFKDRGAALELAATTPLPAWSEPPPPPPVVTPEPELDLTVLAERPETAPARMPSAAVEAAELELRPMRASGDVEGLRRRVGTLVLDERFPGEAHAAWLRESRELAKRVVFSASPMKNATSVVVGRGDTLIEICQKLRRDQKVAVTPRFLEMVNDVSAARLRAGARLKVPNETMSVLVDKDEFRLYLLLGGCFLADYKVGTGRDERTPEGRFSINSKIKNPQWTDPETGRVHNFGDSGHVIGSRWMGFSGEHGKTGFGIHGTTEPVSIGRAESAGCIRMSRDDVEELFDLVPQGAEVVIRR